MATWTFSSWHDRALLTPHPNPHGFIPIRENFLLAMILDSMGEPGGITLAQPPGDDSATDDMIAVDARGRVLPAFPNDAAGILALAKDALELPNVLNWRVKHLRTCLPNYIREYVDIGAVALCIVIPQSQRTGFSQEKRKLKVPVQGFKELPETLRESFWTGS